MLRVLTVFGTRPEAVKLAPVVRALAEAPDIDGRVAVTAQHREMLDQVLDLFGIVPDVDLDILQPGQTLTDITVRALDRLSPLVEELTPDLVIVQGDTTTTMCGALAGFYHRIPVAHVEAGLRTTDRYSPFPEEINRRLTTDLTSLHFPPTATAAANLAAEGVPARDVLVTGNTVIDALAWAVDQRTDLGPELSGLDADRPVLLVTAHRRESWGAPMRAIGDALRDVAGRHEELQVVFPIHRNPVVRDAVLPRIGDLPNVTVTEPLAYGAFAQLMARATVILTDSGGIQEEGPSLGKPVLVMRDTTERPEAIAAGTARLVGTDRDAIVAAVDELLTDPDAYDAMARAVNPYGDGHATPRIVGAIRHRFLGGPPPEPFEAPW